MGSKSVFSGELFLAYITIIGFIIMDSKVPLEDIFPREQLTTLFTLALFVLVNLFHVVVQKISTNKCLVTQLALEGFVTQVLLLMGVQVERG